MNLATLSVFYTLSYPPSRFLNSPALYEGEFTDLDQARDVAFGISEETGNEVWITEHFGASRNLIEVIEGELTSPF